MLELLVQQLLRLVIRKQLGEEDHVYAHVVHDLAQLLLNPAAPEREVEAKLAHGAPVQPAQAVLVHLVGAEVVYRLNVHQHRSVLLSDRNNRIIQFQLIVANSTK